MNGDKESGVTTFFLTYFSRIGVFVTTWALSFAVMLALYPLIRKIQKIGGELWRE